MWYIITFLGAYIMSVYTWPALRSWCKALVEHPEDTIKADIEVLKAKLKGLH